MSVADGVKPTETEFIFGHKPTPWWAEQKDGKSCIMARHRGPTSTFCVAAINEWDDRPEETAAHIVHCVNLHDELVEVLEGILKFEQQKWRDEFLAARDYDALFSRARALVARAKGVVLAKVKP